MCVRCFHDTKFTTLLATIPASSISGIEWSSNRNNMEGNALLNPRKADFWRSDFQDRWLPVQGRHLWTSTKETQEEYNLCLLSVWSERCGRPMSYNLCFSLLRGFMIWLRVSSSFSEVRSLIFMRWRNPPQSRNKFLLWDLCLWMVILPPDLGSHIRILRKITSCHKGGRRSVQCFSKIYGWIHPAPRASGLRRKRQYGVPSSYEEHHPKRKKKRGRLRSISSSLRWKL
jgi:hypothetical protein